jgi:hypothetical protein
MMQKTLVLYIGEGFEIRPFRIFDLPSAHWPRALSQIQKGLFSDPSPILCVLWI